MKVEPVTLIGRTIRLEPLSVAHISSLAKVGLDERIWHYMRYGKIETVEQLTAWVSELLILQSQGSDLPFAVIHLASGAAIGCTRYMHIDPTNRSLEIGGTWYGIDYQGTQVNTECKYLLLTHAFEKLECIRVWFKTDARNKRSQRALAALGAVKEGVLRNHMILPDGYIRDSEIYSIVIEEWPQIKTKLAAKLDFK